MGCCNKITGLLVSVSFAREESACCAFDETVQEIKINKGNRYFDNAIKLNVYNDPKVAIDSVAILKKK